MTLCRDLSLLIGAVFGVTAVFLIPSPSSKKDRNNNKSERNPEIIIQDSDNNIISAEVYSTKNQLLFGESTVLDIINIIKNEISVLLDYTGIRLFVPDATSSSTKSNNRRNYSHFATSDEYAAANDVVVDPTDPGQDTSTFYKALPNKNTNTRNTTPIQTIQSMKQTDHHLSRKYTRFRNKSKFDAPKGQSTLIDVSKSDNIKSGFIVSFKNSKSAIRRVFNRTINLLRIKKNLSQNTSKTYKSNSSSAVLLVNSQSKEDDDTTIYF